MKYCFPRVKITKMTHFKIAGTPDCPFFGHALHVGYFLADKLPNFNLIRLEIEPNKWKVTFLNHV